MVNRTHQYWQASHNIRQKRNALGSNNQNQEVRIHLLQITFHMLRKMVAIVLLLQPECNTMGSYFHDRQEA